MLVLVWMLSGAGAVGGSVLGNAAGKTGLFAGAIVGGLIAAAGGAFLAGTFGWIPVGAKRGASVGALAGFLVAAPFAVLNLHTPLIPIAVTSLAGVGALLGAGMERGASGQ